MALIITPLAFAVLGYGILAFSANSALKSFLSVWSIIATDTSLDTGDGYSDIYNGEKIAYDKDHIPSSAITFPTLETRYGAISINGSSIQDCPLFFGDTNKCLKNGVGQYAGSSFPGCGSTVLIAGHNNGYFNGLKDVKTGDIITISTNYGTYEYRVTKTELHNSTDSSAYDLTADKENIVLYTCYPFNALGLTPQRFFVYGEYVSGPIVLLNE